jgi:enamine deaminase RidA (YjgF/YER057c/UK114 family)
MPGLTRKSRGRVTYYTADNNRQFSTLVTEELASGDLRIYFAGVTGSGAEERGPEGEIPACFGRFEAALREAGICDSLAQVDFLEIHAFGSAPKTPNPLVDAEGFAAARQRTRDAYARAYAEYWASTMPENGLPARFTVYVEDLPNARASFEISGTALLQWSTPHQNGDGRSSNCEDRPPSG